MISQIEGKIRRLLENRVELDVGGITYEILLPARAYQHLRLHDQAKPVRLFTFHYLEGGMTAAPIPRLVGFIHELDRDFFHLMRTVKNIGVKTALNAMIIPINQIARAIENEDLITLKGLPEIGPATAKRIVAELKGKVIKFVLMSEKTDTHPKMFLADYKAEAIEVLLQLGKKRTDAEDWVERTAHEFPNIKESEQLLTEIFKLFSS
jgi:Holliday junction DNA helicase RuvA